MNKEFDFIQIGSHIGKLSTDPLFHQVKQGQKGILIEPVPFENKHMNGTATRGKKYRELVKKFNTHGYDIEQENHDDTTLVSAEVIAKDTNLIGKIINFKRAMVIRKRLVNLNYWCKKYSDIDFAFVE